jgi:hypothetical protein
VETIPAAPTIKQALDQKLPISYISMPDAENHGGLVRREKLLEEIRI